MDKTKEEYLIKYPVQLSRILQASQIFHFCFCKLQSNHTILHLCLKMYLYFLCVTLDYPSGLTILDLVFICTFKARYCQFVFVDMVLASRASGCLLDTQMLQMHPSGHPNFL